MEDHRIEAEEPPATITTSFLVKTLQEDDPAATDDQEEEEDDDDDDDDLEGALRRLETCFRVLGFYWSFKPRSSILSWAVFLVLGLVLPALVFSFFYTVANVESTRIVVLDIGIPVTLVLLAFFSLVCVSHNLRKYGMRSFLFVDKRYQEMQRLRRPYVKKIKMFFPILLLWMLPCIIAKTTLATTLVFFIYRTSWPLAIPILLASVMSWTYLTTVFLSGCSLFYLSCSLQVVHFDDYEELLKNGADVSILFDEHRRLCFYLSKISHRFRLHLILLFFISVVTQAIFLLHTTQFHGVIDFVNVGDFFISSAVQVIGIIICLNAATRISHRAQNMASAASSWHALTTCKEYENMQTSQRRNLGTISTNISGGEHLRTIMQHQMMDQSLFHQREALVMYLGYNNGGITVYGWCVDRGLITTIVCIELSILCFIFSGTL